MTKKDSEQLPVIIIGAGAAGLAAAEQLQKEGHDYLVLEGRKRIGGRIHTDAQTGFELGAAWFHGIPHNEVAKIAEDEGIEAIFDDEQTLLHDDSGPLDQEEFGKISGKFDTLRAQRPPTETLEQAATKFLSELDTDEEKRYAKAVVNLYQLAAGLPTTLIGAQFEAPGGRDQAVQDGYINVFQNLLTKDIDPRKVKLETKVTHISSPKDTDKVRVSTQDGEHYEGRAVIVTVPVATLKQHHNLIEFDPQLNGHLRKAIEATHIVNIDKVYLTFPKTFWNKNVYKFIVTDAESPALVWNWTATHPGTSQQNTIAVLVTNEVAKKVHAHPDEAFGIVTPILEVIAPGQEIPEPTRVLTSSWIGDEFSSGSFSTVAREQTREELAKPFIEGEPRNRVFFAGEHAVVDGAALVQGAWESGKRAVAQVLEL